MTDAACVSYLGFSDVWLDGEILGFRTTRLKILTLLIAGATTKLSHIRAVGIGRQYGWCRDFSVFPRRIVKRHEEMHAILDIHDILGWGLKPLEKHPDVEGFPFTPMM